MLAVTLTEVPGTPAVAELDTPTPDANELLVRVRASSVNGFDLGTITGQLKEMMEHRFPLVPGRDFAGTVEAIGAGVEGFEIGDEVFGTVAKEHLGTGSYAQYATVPAEVGVAHRPAGLSVQEAGALGLAGAAAVASLDGLGELSGRTLLVSGATGGVGAFVVQLAAARGARVIATARPGTEADFVRSLNGAVDVVDYSVDLADQVLSIAPIGVDAVLHLAGDLALLTTLARDGGTVASTLTVPETPGGRRLTTTMIMTTPTRGLLSDLAGLAASGRLTIPIATVYDLDETPEAFAAFTAGTLGKISLSID